MSLRLHAPFFRDLMSEWRTTTSLSVGGRVDQALWGGTTCLSPLDRDHVDGRGQVLFARCEHHAADRGHVGVITADCEHDVVLAGDQRIGGGEAPPAGGAAPQHSPAM